MSAGGRQGRDSEGEGGTSQPCTAAPATKRQCAKIRQYTVAFRQCNGPEARARLAPLSCAASRQPQLPAAPSQPFPSNNNNRFVLRSTYALRVGLGVLFFFPKIFFGYVSNACANLALSLVFSSLSVRSSASRSLDAHVKPLGKFVRRLVIQPRSG